MAKRASTWRVTTTAAADRDIEQIHEWTERRFGIAQAEAYSITIADALVALSAGPQTRGVRDRRAVQPGLYTLHLSRFCRRARHYLVFRTSPTPVQTVDVLRVLHDRMDLARHLLADDAQ